MARMAVDAEQLGRDEHADLLVVGLSSNDIVGHLYGPDSPEVADCTLRTDRQLARFFDWLDAKVGLDRCIVALSSDHGVAPLPEYANDLGLGGGRFDEDRVERLVEQRLIERYGRPDGDDQYVRNLKMPWLYLDEGALARENVDVKAAARLAAQAAGNYEGVARAFAESDIVSPGFARRGELNRAVANSYHPKRSGHVYVHWRRFWYKGDKQAGHGAAYDYDQHVPVALMGPGIKPGTYSRRIDPTGLTVTLCALLGIDKPPAATGVVYREIVETAVAGAGK